MEENQININGQLFSEKEALIAALNFHKTGDFQKAESIYRKVNKANPKNAEALHLSALILYHYGWPDSAIYWIKRAIALNPAQPHYHYNMGVIFMEKNNSEEANKCFLRALELDPDYTKAILMIELIKNK